MHDNHVDASLLQNLLGIAPLHRKQARVQPTRPQLSRRRVMHRHMRRVVPGSDGFDLPLHVLDGKPGVGQDTAAHANPARRRLGEQTRDPVPVSVAVGVVELRRDEKTLAFGLLEGWRVGGDALVLLLRCQRGRLVGRFFAAVVAELTVDPVRLRVLSI